MSRSLLRALADELARLFDPIVHAAGSPEAMERLLLDLGVFDSEATGPAAAFAAVIELKEELETLASQDEVSLETAQAVLRAAEGAFGLTEKIAELGGSTGQLPEMGRDFVDYLLAAWLSGYHPVAREICALLTLLDTGPDQPERPAVVRGDIAVRQAIKLDRVRLDRLPDLLRDPVSVLKARYVNALATEADAAAMADRLFPRVRQLLRALGVSCRYGIKPGDEPQLGDAAALMKHALIVYAVDPLRNTGPEAGVVLALSPASSGDLGLVISPFGALTFTKSFERWTFESTIAGEIDVLAWGRHGLTLLSPLQSAEVAVDLSATTIPQGEGPAYVFGASNGTRLELGSVRLAANTVASVAKQTLSVSADVAAAALVLAAGDGDGFLASILPADGLRADFALGIAWSSEGGLTLRGSGSLETTLPVSASLAGVTLSSIHLRVQALDANVLADVSATLSASIGPVSAVIDRVGVESVLSFPEGGGNVGAANLELGFKPPDGIGLSIDAAVLSGGGFLFHDRTQGVYAGVMQLSLQGILTLKAFGLIGTRMPDGTKGFSLIVFITAEDFKPIPIGMGCVLQGIGGMVAIHRTFSETAMREGLKNGTLGTLLFPKDPIHHAPEIIRNLGIVFPARRGSYMFGVLAKIGWPSPTLVTLDLALIFEFGARKRLIVLGRIQALLPTRDNALIQLNLDSMGLIDFDAGKAEVDAMLVDSRLAKKFVLTGAMALRAGWSGGPGAGFVMAVGGFNPRFVPPASLPSIARLAIALSAGDNPRLTCEAYFAVTSNTLQFGARAELYAAAIGFSVQGDVGFDVLIEFVPFHFLAEFQASLQLKRGSRSLFKVSVAGALEGPRPLRVSGKATFEILWCDFTVRFDKTLVEGERPPLPPAVNVLGELQRALGDAQSWTAQQDAQQQHGVALRKLASAGTDLVLDPLGTVTVKQQVVPLNTSRDIELFGGAPVTGPPRFQLSAALGGQTTQVVGVQKGLFAPAQFFKMNDDEKLASPSFEEMQAGVTFGTDAVTFDDARIVASPLTYETIVVDAAGQSSSPPQAEYPLTPQRLAEQVRHSAVAKAPVRTTGRLRFSDARAPQAAGLTNPSWVVASINDTKSLAANVSRDAGWSEKRAALSSLNRAGAQIQWQLLPEHEA